MKKRKKRKPKDKITYLWIAGWVRPVDVPEYLKKNGGDWVWRQTVPDLKSALRAARRYRDSFSPGQPGSIWLLVNNQLMWKLREVE